MPIDYKLSKVIIHYFRGIDKLELAFRDSFPSVLIGSNNAGKSTVLSAIALALNGGGSHQWTFSEADFFCDDKGKRSNDFLIQVHFRSDHESGYPAVRGVGKPPTHRQFKKGQSGNKKGRPKGSKNVATILKEALSKKVIVRDGDKVRRISKGEAFVETVLNDSLKGDNQARRVFVSMARLTGQLEVPPEDKTRNGGVMRTGGVLLLGPPETPEEWARKTFEQQRPYREAPSPAVKKPDSDDATKK